MSWDQALLASVLLATGCTAAFLAGYMDAANGEGVFGPRVRWLLVGMLTSGLTNTALRLAGWTP